MSSQEQGNFPSPVIINPKLISFFEGRFVTLPLLFAAVYVPGNASSTHCVRGKKGITKPTNDSGREIQASLFLVLLCM